MKETMITPKLIYNDAIIHFSDSVVVDKRTLLTVPNTHEGIVFLNEKIFCKVNPCNNQNVMSLVGKESIGSTIKVAYVSKQPKIVFAWGFGNINVNNERLVEAYRIGANGECFLTLTDAVAMIKYFPTANVIYVEDIRQRVLSIIKTVGVPILGGYFANTNVSVFEIDSKVGEIRQRMFDALSKENEFFAMGAKLNDLTVSGLHVNEDDLNTIRERIND